MESCETNPVAEQCETGPARPGRDWTLILVLLALAAGLRAFAIEHTEVVARDGIVFIDYALQLEAHPWREVLLANHQHPGYPLSILAVSWPVRQALGRTDSYTMQLSAQLASALAGILLVIPMFMLGRILFDRGVAFWATFLFQCLPVTGKVLSDGLSESLFLLWTATGLLMAVRGVQSGASWRFGLCGLCAGLAYLTRPEGLIVVAATGLFLLIMQGAPAWRRGWRWTVASGTCLTLAAIMAGSPYFLAVGKLTNKPSGQDLVRPARHGEPGPQAMVRPRQERGGGALSIFSPPFAAWLNNDLRLGQRVGNGLIAVLGEVLRGFHYVAWLPALLGLWWDRRRLQARPEAWMVACLLLLNGLVLWRLATVAGYVSERHVVLLVMCGLFPAVVGLRDLPRRMLAWSRRASSPGVASAAPWRIAAMAQACSVVLILALAGMGLCRTLQPLHGNRAGHHAAGLWLAAHAGPNDEVCDSHFGWAKYYSGRLLRSEKKDNAPGVTGTRYVVKGSSLERVNPYGPNNAIADMTEKEIHEAGGKPVFHWPGSVSLKKAKVTVWAVPFPLKTEKHGS